MSILTGDLEYRYSTPTASAGNQLAQADPSSSIGGYLSTSVWHGGSPNDLFEDVSGDDNADRVAEYRCLFLVNKNTTLTWQGPVVWFTDPGTSITIDAVGVDTVIASAVTSTDVQAIEVNNVSSPPAGVTFSTPLSKGAGLSLGDIPSGFCKAIWIRRTATASAATTGDGYSIRVEGDTA